jgi:hypothetical protein
MAYADDLLEVAQHLAKLDSTNPRQACLRRSVSTAYYALFHPLIAEAVVKAFESWRRIRDEPVAQAYLVSLLGTRPRA